MLGKSKSVFVLVAVVVAAVIGIGVFVMPHESATGQATSSANAEQSGQGANAGQGADTAQSAEEESPAAAPEVPSESAQKPAFVPVNEKPDLAVLSVKYSPLFPKSSEKIKLVAEVQNLGGKTAQLRKFKLLSLIEGSKGEEAMAEKDILAPGEKTTLTSTWTIPPGIAEAIAGVDVFREVEEYSETNNEMRIKFRVQPAIGFVGCKEFGTNVCDSVLEADSQYFQNHPQCTQIACNAIASTKCSNECPHPRG